MADEGTVLLRLTVSKGNLKVSKTDQITFDVAGTRQSGDVQAIGTTYEALSISSDIATAGMSYFKNHDATNYVEVGIEVAAAFQPVAKLMPGDIACFRPSTVALFARANTAPVDLEFLVVAA